MAYRVFYNGGYEGGMTHDFDFVDFRDAKKNMDGLKDEGYKVYVRKVTTQDEKNLESAMLNF